MANSDSLPRRRRRLWRTLFGWPRDLRQFAPRIPFEEVAIPIPTNDELSHWGEVMLLEDHVAILHRDGTVTYGIHSITHLHGQWNLAQWDQLNWVYDSKIWKPTLRTARLYQPDGTSHNANIARQKFDAQGRLRSLQVFFGPLRPGVIVECEHQDDHFKPFPIGPCHWGQFFLQTSPPCRRRRFTIAVARPFSATIELHNGAEAPERFAVGDYQVYQWDRRDVPGVERDSWLPPARDFLPWVDFSTVPSWDLVADHYGKEIAPTVSGEIHALAQNLTRGAASPRDKLAAIHNYAAQQVRYGRPPQEVYLPASRPVSKMFEDMRGDCKDKAALMVSLLHAVGLDARIAVVITRAHGLRPFLPSQRFDHALVVAELEGKEIWLDPAAGPFTLGDLPFQDQGITALVLDDEQRTLVAVPEPKPEDQGVEWICKGRLTESGDCELQAEFSAWGERAAFFRQALFDRNAEYRDRWLRHAFAQALPGAEINDVKIESLDDLSDHVRFRYRLTLHHWAQPVGAMLLVRVPWAEPTRYEGPLAAPERPAPLSGSIVQVVKERHEIELPAGYAAVGLPMECHEKCAWADFLVAVHLEDNRLVCTRRQSYLGDLVPVERFADFKRFWVACTRADSVPIVLTRRA